MRGNGERERERGVERQNINESKKWKRNKILIFWFTIVLQCHPNVAQLQNFLQFSTFTSLAVGLFLYIDAKFSLYFSFTIADGNALTLVYIGIWLWNVEVEADPPNCIGLAVWVPNTLSSLYLNSGLHVWLVRHL